MEKSSIERAIEKQQRETKRIANEEARRQTASAIISGQPTIGGMRIMDAAAEEILEIILSAYNDNPERHIEVHISIFPAAYRFSLSQEFEKLRMYGMVSNPQVWINGTCTATLMPQGITYFENKVAAMKKAESEKEKQVTIGSIIANDSNLVFGDAINSALSINNSTSRIEQEIDEKGEEEKEELLALLEEVKELIENMQDSRHIPRNKGLFSKLSGHLEKHGWFYAEVVGLMGSAVMQMLQK